MTPDSTAMTPTRTYHIGDSAPRPEDDRLLRGGGRYSDDLSLPGQAWGVMLRSTLAHGAVRSLKTELARQMPGVLAVYTAADLDAAGYGPLRCKLPLKNADGSPLNAPPRPALASDRVRYVGEGLAFVVAETLAQARDAAEVIEVDIDPLPAVVDLTVAAAAGTAQLHAEAPANTALDWAFGDGDAIAANFAEAAHVTRLRVVNSRVTVSPMEPRAALAAYDDQAGRFVLRVGCQGAFGLSRGLAEIMGVEPDRLQVLTGEVGGSFGMKAPPYPEYVAALHATRALGRPVKWRDERTESFLSDQHGRDSVTEAELALDADGRFLAIRAHTVGNMGAYLSTMGPQIPSINILKNLPGAYATPALYLTARCVFTNMTPVGPYRGAGRPEGVNVMERLIDTAARETGADPADLRRRNLIPSDAMPYTAASGQPYDSGDFATILDQALVAADWDGFSARRRASEGRGLLRGRGLVYYVEVTAPQGKEMGGLRFGPDGQVTIVTGTLDYGQGHRAAFAQVLGDKLGVPFDRVTLLQGDSSQLLFGGGTGGSRSIMASGKAILDASDQVIDKGKQLAGHYLEAAPADIEFAGGLFTVAGTDRAIGLADIVVRLADGETLPEGVPAALDSELVSETPPSAFPNGCHVCEVEIDPDTGAVRLDRYTVVDDFGTIVNPMLVEGQVHGGIVQGLGQALMEAAVYDAHGQPLSGSFMDYAMPRADDVPDFRLGFHPVPATTNPLGVKGCGEAGTTGAIPAVINAIADALAQAGAAPVGMPATAEKVWRSLRAVRG
jgi:carbon-monoxide dehydrogenase large subunit